VCRTMFPSLSSVWLSYRVKSRNRLELQRKMEKLGDPIGIPVGWSQRRDRSFRLRIATLQYRGADDIIAKSARMLVRQGSTTSIHRTH